VAEGSRFAENQITQFEDSLWKLEPLEQEISHKRFAKRAVKALNNMIVPNWEATPSSNGARRVAFISADDDGAKRRGQSLLEGFGYSVIDLGNLRVGGLIQQAGGPLAGRDLFKARESVISEDHSSPMAVQLRT